MRPVVMILILGALVLLCAAAYLLTSRDSGQAGQEGRSLQAPPSDLLVVIQPGEGPVVNAQELNSDVPFEGLGRAAPGTLVHGGTTIIDGNPKYLLTFDTELGTRPHFCVGTFDGSGSMTMCDLVGAEPLLSVGGSGGDGGVVLDVTLGNAPANAAWMVVETDAGLRIVSNVIAGVSHAEWDGAMGDPQIVTLVDLEHNAIWTQVLGGL